MTQSEIQTQDRPYDAFWDYFQEIHEGIEHLYRSGHNVQAVHDIGQMFNRVVPELDFEFGLHPDGYFEFIIIAGLRANIPLVLDMYDAAPQIDGWVIVPFRPRQECYVINMPNRDYDPNDFYYKSEVCEQGITHLNIYIKGYSADKEQEFGGMAFMFLDKILGEYEVMTLIGGVQVGAYPDNADAMEIKPIYELQQEIDQRYPPNA